VLIKTLDDREASVWDSAANVLANLGDSASVEALKRRMEVEESIHVRAPLEQALNGLRNIVN
jgi:HEAT repeat protein